MCSHTAMVRCECACRQTIGAEPRGVVIDFGCAQELGPDACISVAFQFVHSFAMEGNQYGRAPELFIELDAAKREVRSCPLTSSCAFVSAIVPVLVGDSRRASVARPHVAAGSRRGAAVRQAAEL